MWRREYSRRYRDSNSNLSVVQPVASRYTDYVIPVSGVEMCSVPKQGSSVDTILPKSPAPQPPTIFKIHALQTGLSTELEDSKPIVSKAVFGHDPESAPSTAE
jgi:hypothetical protein